MVITMNNNKYGLFFLLALSLGLNACTQNDTSETVTQQQDAQQQEMQITVDDDDHKHYEGDGHDHHHGTTYRCDNNQTITIIVDTLEGEEEVHAIIDDIEYDMHPDGKNPNYFIAHDEGIDNTPMSLTLDSNTATFKALNDNRILLSCQK